MRNTRKYVLDLSSGSIKFMFNLVYRVNGKPVKILVELI